MLSSSFSRFQIEKLIGNLPEMTLETPSRLSMLVDRRRSSPRSSDGKSTLVLDDGVCSHHASGMSSGGDGPSMLHTSSSSGSKSPSPDRPHSMESSGKSSGLAHLSLEKRKGPFLLCGPFLTKRCLLATNLSTIVEATIVVHCHITWNQILSTSYEFR